MKGKIFTAFIGGALFGAAIMGVALTFPPHKSLVVETEINVSEIFHEIEKTHSTLDLYYDESDYWPSWSARIGVKGIEIKEFSRAKSIGKTLKMAWDKRQTTIRDLCESAQ